MDTESIESVTFTREGTDYKLARELTGRQYLELRRRSLRKADNSSGSADPNAATSQVDETEYEIQNLYTRLIEPKFSSSEEMIDSMSRKTLQALTLAAVKLDNEEAGDVVDFLRENSELFGESALNSLPSLNSPPVTSEASPE